MDECARRMAFPPPARKLGGSSFVDASSAVHHSLLSPFLSYTHTHSLSLCISHLLLFAPLCLCLFFNLLFKTAFL